jgi:tRNA-binding protein
MTEPIEIGDFLRVDIRAGRVARAEVHTRARMPAYKLWIDFGDLGVRQSSAQVTALYAADDLVGRIVLAVTNLPPRRVAGFSSQVLVLGIPSPDGSEVLLIGPDRDVAPGSRVR